MMDGRNLDILPLKKSIMSKNLIHSVKVVFKWQTWLCYLCFFFFMISHLNVQPLTEEHRCSQYSHRFFLKNAWG